MTKFWLGLLVFLPSVVAAGPREIVRRLCESHLTSVDPAVAFERRARAILEADAITTDEATWIGENLLRYPEIFNASYRANHSSPVGRLFQDRALAAAFFGADPLNGLFLRDLISVSEWSNVHELRDILEPVLLTIVTTDARELRRFAPQLDVPSGQYAALHFVKRLGLSHPRVTAAAFSFLRASPLRRAWTRVARAFNHEPRGDALGTRALAARAYLVAELAHGRLTSDQIETLVDGATDPSHPYRDDFWEALNAPDRLSREHVARLRGAWPLLPALERHWLRHAAPLIVARVEAKE